MSDEINPEVFDDESQFRQVTFSGENVYIVPSPGLTVRGQLLGRFAKQGESFNSHCYRVELTHPCEAYRGGGEGKEAFIAHPGTVVMLDDRKAMGALEEPSKEVRDQNAIFEVIVRFKDKITTNKKQSFWDIQILIRRLEEKPIPTAMVD